jgi:hypothetical protein
MPKLRRVVRLAVKGTGFVVGGTAALVTGTFVGLSTDWGNELMLDQVAEAAKPAFPGGALIIGKLDTNFIGHIAVEDVAIQDMNGKTLIGFERFEVGYNLAGLAGGKVVVDTLRLDKPMVDLTMLEDGTLDIEKVFGPSKKKKDKPSEPWTGIGIDLEVPAIQIVGGTVAIGGHTTPVQIDELGLDVGVGIQGAVVHVDHLDLLVDMVQPYDLDIKTEGEIIFTGADVIIPAFALSVGETVIELGGKVKDVQGKPEMELKLGLNPLAPSTLETVVGEPVLKQAALYEALVTGPLAELRLDTTLSSEGLGEMDLDVGLGLESDPMWWEVAVVPKAFEVDGLVAAVPVPVKLDGTYGLKGTGTDWPLGIQAKFDLQGNDQVLGGEPVSGLVLLGMLDAGRVTIDTFKARHAVAVLDITGWADVVESKAALDIDVRIPSAAGLSRYGAGGFGGSAGFTGHADAQWAPQVDAVVDGELFLRDFQAPGAFVREGGGPIHVEVHGEAASGSGTITVAGLNASGISIDSVRIDFEGGKAASGAIEATAGLDIDNIAMPDGLFEMEGLEGELVAQVSPGGSLAANIKLDVETFSLSRGAYVVEGGPVEFKVADTDVWADINLRRAGEPFLTGRIDGDLETGQWDITGFEFAVIAKDGLQAQQDISFKLSDGGIEGVVFDISNPGGKGKIRIEGNANADSPDIHLIADNVSLAYVMSMVDEVMRVLPSGAPPTIPPPPEEAITEDTAAREEPAAAPQPAGEGDGDPASEPKPTEAVARTEQTEVVVEREPNPLDGLAGMASIDLRVKKEGDALTATGWVSIDDLVVPKQVNKADIRIDLELTADKGIIEVKLSRDEDIIVLSQGTVPVKQKAGNVELDWDGRVDVRTLVPALKFQQLAKTLPVIGKDLQGRASMDLRIVGPTWNPDIDLVAAVDTPVGSQGERARIDLKLRRKNDAIVLETTVEADNQRYVRVDAELATQLTSALDRMLRKGEEVDMADPSTWLDGFDTSISLLAIPLENLTRLVEVTHPLDGVLGGGINVKGTLAKPVVTGGIVIVDGRVGEVDMDQITIALAPDPDGYRFDTDLVFSQNGRLGIHGHLPLALDFTKDMDLDRPGLALTMDGTGIPLGMAAGPGGISDAKGLIALTGSVGGTLANPVPIVEVDAKDAGFTLAATALRYEPINIDIDFTTERLTIHNFKMKTSQLWATRPREGSFKVKGLVDLDNGEPTNVDITARMKEFWLSSTKAANLAISGKIGIQGDYPNLGIKGRIAMDEARFEIGQEVLKQTSGLVVDEQVVIHRKSKEVVRVKKEEEAPSVADNFDIDLKVDFQQNVVLKADIPLAGDSGFAQLATFSMDLGLDGKLRIGQQKGILSVTGELMTLRGELNALGKRFGIEEGLITFTGENFANPMLDLTASHQVGQYGKVNINIMGDVTNTQMEFSSPEYPDQTDVMSMLLFGKPTSAMSETEGESGSGVLSAALSTVGGQAARASGAAFLQNVAVDPGSGSVKVGFPLSEKVYLSIERLKPESDTDNTTQAALEWLLARRSYAEFITGDKGKSSSDLYWRWRF